MRKTSLVLGIIGSLLALVLGSFTIIDACCHTFMDDFYGYGNDYYYYDDYYYDGEYDSLAADETLPNDEDTANGIEPYIDRSSIVSGSIVVLGGLLGVIGSVLVKRKSNTAAGILFIIAAVGSIGSFYPSVLFVIAAVFVLKRERPAVPMMGYPLPGWYPAYPPSYPPPAWPAPMQQGVPAYPPHGAYPPPWPPPAYPAPMQQGGPAYPPQGVYPPYPTPAQQASVQQTAPAYAPHGTYPPPWPYGYAWPAAPPVENPQPPDLSDPKEKAEF